MFSRHNRLFVYFLNTIVIGGYIATVLLLIRWVSIGQLGIGAFFALLGILLLLAIGWMFVDKRRYSTSRTYSKMKKQRG